MQNGALCGVDCFEWLKYVDYLLDAALLLVLSLLTFSIFPFVFLHYFEELCTQKEENNENE